MKILIAEDDAVSLHMLQATLVKWGHEVKAVTDGAQAWNALREPDAPQLAVLDWMMPELDGTEVCRRVRALKSNRVTYLLLLTAKGQKQDIVTGLQAGADDYVTKPFDREELKARLNTGIRIVELQNQLAARIQELEASLRREKQLKDLLPVCSYCNQIRDERDQWQSLESYLSEHSTAQFTHSICPSCRDRLRSEMVARRRAGAAPAVHASKETATR